MKCTLMEIGILQCRSESESEVVQQIQCHMKSDSTGKDGAIQSNAPKLSPLMVVGGGGLEIKDFLFPYPADANLVHIGLEFLRKRVNGQPTTTNAYPYLSTHVT